MKQSITVGDIKRAIADLPDDLPVYAANPLGSERLDICYYLTRVNFQSKSSISNPHLALWLGDEFGW